MRDHVWAVLLGRGCASTSVGYCTRSDAQHVASPNTRRRHTATLNTGERVVLTGSRRSGAGGIVPDVVDTGNLANVASCELPSALNDPGQRSVQARGFVFDLREHGLWKVETLLSLVASRRCVAVCHESLTSPLRRSGWSTCHRSVPRLTAVWAKALAVFSYISTECHS